MTFKPYGITISLAILAAALWTAREFKKAGENPSRVWEALPWVVTFGVIGARLYHVVHYWGYYAQDFVKILEVWHGGLGIYGGLLGGLIGLLVFKSKIYNLKSRIENFRLAILDFRSLLWWLDLAAPGIVLGQAIGRLGNIVNREILPFAFYEMIWDLLVFGLLVRSVKLGKRFWAYLFLYALGRFFLEFSRTDNVWRVGVLTMGQLVSLVIVLVVTIRYCQRTKSLL